MDDHTQQRYRDLDQRMKALAESDGDIYLPNPEPKAPADYVLVCMEPSLGHWARSAEEARAKVAWGFRNFLAGMEPMLLHFAVRRFLCAKGQRYHITDFSKGAMLQKHAGAARTDRYDRWYGLLQEEIDLIAAPGASVIAVGNAVAAHLARRGFSRPVTPVLHYSPLAGQARIERLRGCEEGFREFDKSWSLADVVATAEEVLVESGVPPHIYKEALASVTRSQLSDSRRRLVYCYKLDFEAVRADAVSGRPKV